MRHDGFEPLHGAVIIAGQKIESGQIIFDGGIVAASRLQSFELFSRLLALT